MDDWYDCAMETEKYKVLKQAVKDCIKNGWDIRDVLAEIYNIYQEYLISEEQESKLYELADPKELYNSPQEYWYNGRGCLPLWECLQ